MKVSKFRKTEFAPNLFNCYMNVISTYEKRRWNSIHSLFALSIGLLLTGDLFSQSSFSHPGLFGERAAGMGGAFSAISDDATGTYYNPGGLTFNSASGFAATSSVYESIENEYKNVELPPKIRQPDLA